MPLSLSITVTSTFGSSDLCPVLSSHSEFTVDYEAGAALNSFDAHPALSLMLVPLLRYRAGYGLGGESSSGSYPLFARSTYNRGTNKLTRPPPSQTIHIRPRHLLSGGCLRLSAFGAADGRSARK
ncbi:hypothetical protein EVAR_55728_1 [Eumeta japonica]|uniref:Uncharacterized protein n=1 Tax=Eumeta variegata TaxID=151549 RepID=A0A4C1Z1Y5_EUMVA|nr:hypothetical protein EVAR_55728_1 [Eumeta japonica]